MFVRKREQEKGLISCISIIYQRVGIGQPNSPSICSIYRRHLAPKYIEYRFAIPRSLARYRSERPRAREIEASKLRLSKASSNARQGRLARSPCFFRFVKRRIACARVKENKYASTISARSIRNRGAVRVIADFHSNRLVSARAKSVARTIWLWTEARCEVSDKSRRRRRSPGR